MTKKLRGHSGKKFAMISRNSWCVNGRGCWCIGTADSGPKCAQSWHQIQTLKKYIFCHIYCVDRCTHLYRTVTAFRAVSNRESRYPHVHLYIIWHGSKPRIWHGSNIKFQRFLRGKKCFPQLKISNPRISCTVNGVRRSSWKVVWVTKWSCASETSVKWQIFCSCSWQAIDTC